MHALALRWFGGPGQQPAPYDVPLELVTEALDLLGPDVDRLGLLGTSFGAELALVTAAQDDRRLAVVALAPSSVVWAGVDESVAPGRVTSHWTRDGEPLPYVPFDERWRPTTSPPSYRDLYGQSLRTHHDRVSAATIEAELITGEVVLVAGGDDEVWPSSWFAGEIERRRALAGLPTTVILEQAAGHRVVLPGERLVRRGQSMARGGTPASDAALGRRAWPHVCRALSLGPYAGD